MPRSRDSYVLIDACGRLAGLTDTSSGMPKAGQLIPAEWIAEALDAFHNPAPIESRVRETVLRFSEAASHDEYFTASLLLSRGAYWELGERFDSLVSSAEEKMTQARTEAHREAPELAGGSLEEEMSRYGDRLSAEERFALEVSGRARRPVNARRMFWAAGMSQAAANAPRLRKLEVEGVSASAESGLRERTAVAKLRVEFDDGTVRREAVLLEEVAGRMLFATVERRWWLYEPVTPNGDGSPLSAKPK